MNGQLYQSSGRIVLPGNRDEPARRLGSARMIALLDRATALPECGRLQIGPASRTFPQAQRGTYLRPD